MPAIFLLYDLIFGLSSVPEIVEVHHNCNKPNNSARVCVQVSGYGN